MRIKKQIKGNKSNKAVFSLFFAKGISPKTMNIMLLTKILDTRYLATREITLLA